MSSVTYNRLFTLKISHSFFTNNKCNCFDYSQGENSKNLIHRYGFKVSFSNDGFHFYSTKNTSVKELLTYIKKVTRDHYFDFNVCVTNNDFFNYTDLPLNWNGTLIYDSLNYYNKTTESHVVLAPEFLSTNISSSFLNLKIDFDTIIKLSNVGSEVPVFNINFKSRYSIWEYYIIDRTSITSQETTISGSSDIQFIKRNNVKLLNGDIAMKLTSNRGIAFSQSPRYKFSLANIKKGSNGLHERSETQIIVSGLPNPSLHHIDTIDFKGKRMVSSPMYIYV